MGKQKFYAVRVGRTPGIYQTWNQTKEQVDGYSGAEYKSFYTFEEAEDYLKKLDVSSEKENIEDVNVSILKDIENLKENQVIAFVDGSYSHDVKGSEKYSFGAVLITKDSKINLYKAYVNKEYMESRQVAGEVEGVKQAINWAINNKKEEIIIFYDYEGIEKWVTQEWKTEKKVAIDYINFINKKSNLIKIQFRHVKAHSGITYNEQADELAKKALLTYGYKTYDDGSILFTGFEVYDWIKIIDEINRDNEENSSRKRIVINKSNPNDYSTMIKAELAGYSLTIHCYKGKKSFVQGKQSPLFQRVISFAIEKLPNNDEVIEVLNSYHALTIKEEEVYNKFHTLLPNFPNNFSDFKLYNTLLSAVYNTMLVGYMPEYTCLITPIFRVTEFYLHRILHDKLNLETYRQNKNVFNYFSKENNRYYYNANRNELNDDQIDLLNDFYNFYCQVRHPYTHWMPDSLDSHVITDINVARELLLEGLQLVDNYYRIF